MFFSMFPLPQLLPTSLHTELYVLSLFKTQKQQNRNQTNNKRCQNKTKSHEETMGVVLCWPCTPRLGSALMCGLYPVRLLWRNLIFSICQHLSIADIFLVRGETTYPLPPLCAGISSGWTRVGLVLAATVWGFICVSVPLCLEFAVALVSPSTSGY